jgi:hypothetical protein
MNDQHQPEKPLTSKTVANGRGERQAGRESRCELDRGARHRSLSYKALQLSIPSDALQQYGDREHTRT